MLISTFAWVAVGVAVWLAAAALVGVLIGRMIRNRDRQVPKGTSAGKGGGPRIPAQGTAAHPGGPQPPPEGPPPG